MKFLDTNIVTWYLTRDYRVKADACLALFQSIDRGDEVLFTAETVIAEVAYVLSHPRGPYQLNHGDIRDRLLPNVARPGLRIPRKSICIRAMGIYANTPTFDFEDGLGVAHMEGQHIHEIVSYDRDFDMVPGITRVEPRSRTKLGLAGSV